MTTLRFDDGITIDTGGPMRKLRLSDGVYVVGCGTCVPVADDGEADELLRIDFVRRLPLAHYAPSDSMEHFDRDTGTFYNRAGQAMRDPDEYDPGSEGYTPFGDE